MNTIAGIVNRVEANDKFGSGSPVFGGGSHG
jgi:hypothetical protein